MRRELPQAPTSTYFSSSIFFFMMSLLQAGSDARRAASSFSCHTNTQNPRGDDITQQQHTSFMFSVYSIWTSHNFHTTVKVETSNIPYSSDNTTWQSIIVIKTRIDIVVLPGFIFPILKMYVNLDTQFYILWCCDCNTNCNAHNTSKSVSLSLIHQ